MLALTPASKNTYRTHGWSDYDIKFVEENCTILNYGNDWVLTAAVASDGVLWIYPASANDKFPVSLWKLIKEYIVEYGNVVIPMSKNMDKVDATAKRYNGYLLDNMYLFGDELKGLQFYEGKNRWLALNDL